VTNARVVQNLFVTLGLSLRDGSSLDATTLTDYRTRVTSARNALTTAISSAQDQVNDLRNTAAELDRVTRALELARAKATPETVREAEQTVLQARAKLRSAEASFEKTLIRAPFNGQISSRHAEIGETVSSGNPIMEFLGTNAYTIEANVPEADITKIAQGDKAQVTLDAYGDNFTFSAKVIEIEPASTEIEGVSTYKTTFSIEGANSGIRSGMTANVTLKKVVKENALVIPARAVSTEEGKSFVSVVQSDGTVKKTEVSLGSRNNAREVEVVKGVSEGDQLLLPKAQ
jgi:HlyD family secretion protein